MAKLDKGFIQIYTGNGKGKSTAAIGQAVRASGYGFKSLIIQFMKEFPYSELNSLEKLKEYITVEQYCDDDFVLKRRNPSDDEIKKAENALKITEQKMLSGEYDLVILDEVCVSIYFGLLKTANVLSLMKKKPDDIELILTGRYCPEELKDYADLVTEMNEVKHYFQKGVLSRKGIES